MLLTLFSLKDINMQYNYNTQGITSSSGTDPRNLGGSEGYGNTSSSSSSSSTGLMSSPSNSNDNDTNDEPSFFESIANLFSSNGGNLPDSNSNDDSDSGMSLYSGPMFTTSEDNSSEIQDYLGKASVDSAMYEALGVANPEIYLGKMPEEEEPEPNIDTDVLQGELQPEPITVEEIDVKAGDTLSAIAKDKGVPLQDVIDANPQIGNPDLIRPGEKVTIPSILSDAGKLFMAATDPQAPAPVSEDPDRQFYQSGVPIEDRVFDGTDPRNLGGAEGYGSVGTPPAADAGLMTRPKARPDSISIASKAPTKKELVASVFKAEGGYSTDKDDTGNYYNGKFVGTNHGIAAKTLATHLGRTPTVADMKKLTKDDARQIAEEKYYDRFAIDELPSELQEIVFHAVFMGETRGVRAMQNLLGLEPDGKLGSITKKAMSTASFSKKDFRDEYLRELQFGTPLIQPKTNRPYSEPSQSWNTQSRGWTNRYTKLAK
tara:strand:- start:7 stop:1467 length:1461 start_codon:yes stop_codon:yes gene_type:complete